MATSQSRSLDAEAPLAERKSPVHKLPLMEMRDMLLNSNLLLYPGGDAGKGPPHPALRLDPASSSRPDPHFVLGKPSFLIPPKHTSSLVSHLRTYSWIHPLWNVDK